MEMEEIKREIIPAENGGFPRLRRWIKGWVSTPCGRYINGITGKETEITIYICEVLEPEKIPHSTL